MRRPRNVAWACWYAVLRVRMRLVGVLAGGGRCVCDLQDKVPVPANLLSYHLRVLREAGLVTANPARR